jgi:hypothetical protein
MEFADLVPEILPPDGNEAAAHPASAIHEAPSSANEAVGAIPVIVPGSGPTPISSSSSASDENEQPRVLPPLVEASFAF